MENEKDRYGEKMRLVERAKEDIYFAEKDRELIEKLRKELREGKKPHDRHVVELIDRLIGPETGSPQQAERLAKEAAREIGIESILVATDFSPHSDYALKYATQLARGLRARIVLLHVIEPLHISITDTLNIAQHDEALRMIAQTLLENARAALQEQKVEAETRLARGIPYREILHQSKEDDVDLIVLGTHGRTGLEHFVLGSVAERIVRLSDRAVLTLKPRGGTET